MQILLVEDEVKIADFIERTLVSAGYDVTHITDGEEGSMHALSGRYDLIILDVSLPGRDGFEILTELRTRFEQTPVLMLTARSEVEDRVKGLDLGANDYITKPFSLSELLARVRSQLRTIKRGNESSIEAGDLKLDLTMRKVYRENAEISLTSREFELLLYLMNNAGRTLTRDEILSEVWGYQHNPGTNVVEVYVRYLRAKLEKTPGRARIETVRSVGYQLVL